MLNHPIQKKSNVRWVVAFMMWAAIAINYIDRTVLSAAAPYITEEFNLTAGQMGIIMSGFFWSYALLQLPSGWAADKYGQKKTLGFAVVWWSVATALTGLATGFKSLLGLRVALGVGEAAAYPSNAGIAAKWFPKKERATVAGIFDSGSKFGGAVAMPLIAWMIAVFDWKLTFLLIGLVGVVWGIVWMIFFKENPADHKRVNEAELAHIREGQAHMEETGGGQPLKWYQLFKYRNIWAMCVGFFMINYNSYFFITWLPTYLVKERGMDLIEMGIMASLPLLTAMVVEVGAGWMSDRIYAKGKLSLTAVRKLFLIIGLAMASCIGFAAFADSAILAVILLCVAKSGTTVAASQVWALPGDVAPKNMTSMVAGIQNTVSNMGGVVGPIITGFIVGATGSFVPALLFSAALIVIAILNYLFLLGKVKQIQV
ncbi:MFS transporter [Bacillus sp. BS3(2021)]|uniref:MFS transporter n=1 Tax=Bacillus TaxID=1386 RepID=UPI0011A05CCB|nr:MULTISPECIES: MFS transporter [Bacillus]MCD2367675.1 MFS transporter [Bacillus sp. BS3(2021)]MCJ8229068.1 MFS transporter [Bacillus paralicheniformis]MEC4199804.1 MFS transporter [Bacillus sp. AAVF1]TWJ43455.1 putative galactarate transporter [Bacillus paralicheniformis]